MRCIAVSNLQSTMSVEYIEITDPTYLATREERNDPKYVLVKPTKEYSKVPIPDPNWEPQPCCMTEGFKNLVGTLQNLEIRPDDVWLTSHPRSGTTWSQEMVWLICNDLDFDRALKLPLIERFPSMRISGLYDYPEEYRPFKDVLEMQSPRFIQSHLPVGLLPAQVWTVKPKIVYVYRNPKSVVVSYYHHSSASTGYQGSLEDFTRSFMKDLHLYSPYHENVIEYNELAHLDNILILKYEKMKKDLRSTVEKVCTFFNKHYTEEQITKLCEHLSFESMKDNPSVSISNAYVEEVKLKARADIDKGFVRKGQMDGWKTELPPELQNEIDAWTKRKAKSEKHLKLFS